MELYIRVIDGKPFEHPIFEDNFREAFPDIDVKNLPPEFAKFVRVEKPKVGVYENYDGVTYEFVDGIVTDVHHVSQMTAEQIQAKQNLEKERWARTGFVSWTFNEQTCLFDPPVPYPSDNKVYRWDEKSLSWVEVTYAK